MKGDGMGERENIGREKRRGEEGVKEERGEGGEKRVILEKIELQIHCEELERDM